jgi:hypothetical protein
MVPQQSQHSKTDLERSNFSFGHFQEHLHHVDAEWQSGEFFAKADARQGAGEYGGCH